MFVRGTYELFATHGSMFHRRKICVVLINRANYGRLKPVLAAIKAHPDLELQIVVGSSMLIYRYGRSIDQVQKDGFTVDATLHMQVEGETPITMAKSLGLAFIELPSIYDRLKPDVVLVNADRYETLAVAACAAYMNIPVAHTLGGELTGTIDDYVRHAITKFADIHFPAHSAAAKRICQMGENPKRVFVVGNPSLDIVAKISESVGNEQFWDTFHGTGASIDFSKPYLLAMQHPVTTEYGKNYDHTRELLAALDTVGMPTVMLWPNNDAGSDEVSKAMREHQDKMVDSKLHFFRNLPVEVYLQLLKGAECMVGNSSSGIMEAGFMGVPCVNIGTRQEGRELTRNVVNVVPKKDDISEAITRQIAHGAYEPDLLFGDGGAGPRVADVLARVAIDTRKKFFHIENESNKGIHHFVKQDESHM